LKRAKDLHELTDKADFDGVFSEYADEAKFNAFRAFAR
jgi:hypothetical protein